MLWSIIDFIGWVFISLIAFPVSTGLFGWIPAYILKGIYKISGKEFSVKDFLEDIWSKGYLYIYLWGMLSFSMFLFLIFIPLMDYFNGTSTYSFFK